MLNRSQVISVFAMIVIIFLAGCNSAPSRDISLREMLIAENDLPDGWEIIRIDPDPIMDNIAYDRAIEMIFYYKDNPQQLTRGGVAIYQYNREHNAIDSYEGLENTFFNQERVSVITPFFVPEGFNFSSSVANQWHFSCHGTSFRGLLEKSTVCQSLARYEEFVVFGNINIEYEGEKAITTEELQSLFEAIDQQIASSLEDHPSIR